MKSLQKIDGLNDLVIPMKAIDSVLTDYVRRHVLDENFSILPQRQKVNVFWEVVHDPNDGADALRYLFSIKEISQLP